MAGNCHLVLDGNGIENQMMDTIVENRRLNDNRKKSPFFYSPFTEESVKIGEGPALLVQFILSEILKSENTLYVVDGPEMAPYDWSFKHGSMRKVQEHARLLPFAFPALAAEAGNFIKQLTSPCTDLLALLDPFIFACRKSENLLYFLLKQKAPHIKPIQDKICPEGPDYLKIYIVTQYQKRGFYPSKWIR